MPEEATTSPEAMAGSDLQVRIPMAHGVDSLNVANNESYEVAFVADNPGIWMDHCHNLPHAAQGLEQDLAGSGFARETSAVLGMLRDKDIAGVVRAVAPRVTRWHLATLGGERGATATELAAILLAEKGSAPVAQHASATLAFAAAREEAGENDKIVVFGSFLTVGEVMAYLEAVRGGARSHG